MIIDMQVNVVTVTSVILAAVAVLSYARTVKQDVNRVRENDLKHVDAKLDTLTRRVDEIYRLMVLLRGKE